MEKYHIKSTYHVQIWRIVDLNKEIKRIGTKRDEFRRWTYQEKLSIRKISQKNQETEG